MIKIARKDFNMDMDRYISSRRARESYSESKSIGERFSDMRESMGEWRVFSLFKKKERVYVEDDEEDVDEDFSEEEAEIEAIDELEEDLEERREGVLRRFFRKLRLSGRRRVEDEEVLEAEESEFESEELDDVREALKVTHRWLEELPPETLEQFKRSEDFEKYKSALKRLGMIK